MVTWQETSRDPDRSRSWYQYVGTHYLQYDWSLEIHVELWIHVTINFQLIQLHSDRNILCVLQMALDRLHVLLNIILLYYNSGGFNYSLSISICIVWYKLFPWTLCIVWTLCFVVFIFTFVFIPYMCVCLQCGWRCFFIKGYLTWLHLSNRSCNVQCTWITVRDRSLRRRSASRLYCVCTEALMNSFVHVSELVSGWLGANPDQPLTSRRRHQLPRTTCSRQKSVWLVLDLRPALLTWSFVAETFDCWPSCEHWVRSFRTPCVVVSCAVSVSDAVLLWRTIDWTVEHRRIFVICVYSSGGICSYYDPTSFFASCLLILILYSKHIAVTSLTFRGDVTSSVTWPFDTL